MEPEGAHLVSDVLKSTSPNAVSDAAPDCLFNAKATRSIRKGDIVAPAPLVHIPFKDSMLWFGELQDTITPEGHTIRNTSDVRGKQLLLNYCFGHSKSTLLLCPYGSGTTYINHNHQAPNVQIVWTEESTAIFHNLTWLNKTVDFLEDQLSPGLEFDYVAIKDIQPGEEVFLDYGKEWDQAWKSHLDDWMPVEGADNYVDASQLNCYDEDECKNAPVVKTYDEQEKHPYPDNLRMWCYFDYEDERKMVFDINKDEWRDWERYVAKTHHRYPCKSIIW